MKPLATLALLLGTQAAAAQVSTLNRPLDPVVLTGANLPAFVGLVPGSLVGFRYGSSGWQQIPVQVDERVSLDIVAPYGPNGMGANYPAAASNPRLLFYADASTLVGADPVPTFDADDELVFMVKDAGGRAGSTVALPAGVVAGTLREIGLTDPLSGGTGYVYLFQSTGTLLPGAGASYVTYTSNLASTAGFPVNANTTNAENTRITTARYSWHFAAEWVNDELKIVVGNNTDILDRYKNFFYNGFCGRNEDTFSAAENAFIAVKAGPVRVIRSLMGANSGPLTQRTHLFYEGRHDISTNLRVHNIPSVQDVFDYNSAANGMVYRNNLNLSGVTIDGIPDNVATGSLTWEQVSGTPGTLSILHSFTTTLTAADATFGSYYDDNSAAPASTCTGDGQAWGTSGQSVTFLAPNSPCTDPLPPTGCGQTSPSFRSLRFDRTLYFDPATAPATTAATYSQQRSNPLQIMGVATAAAAPREPVALSVYPNPATGPVIVLASRAGQLRVYNALGQLRHTQAIQLGPNEVRLLETGLLLFEFTSGSERQVVRQVLR
ncbi:MAG: T9SS type A sorting domain-containing protein [Bacteroidota bacterium]|nr:T9SS type A sorting domain-containing protein [Bacteroidota bacterium]